MTNRSAAGAAGGSSRNVFETLKLTIPSAIAIESENTAIAVSFQCFRRFRMDRRVRINPFISQPPILE
jgi:hypothetical protein